MKNSILFFGMIIFIVLLTIPQIFAKNLEDSVIILKSDNFNKTEETIKYIEDEGGKVDQVFIPKVIFARLPKNFKLNDNILSIDNNIANENAVEDKFSKIAIKVWNKKFIQEETINSSKKGKGEPGPILNDALKNPFGKRNSFNINNEVILEAQRSQEGILSAPPNSGPSDYLYGKVLISINLLESNGQIDPSTENWDSTRETNVINEINNGLAWWLNKHDSTVNLTMYYIANYGVPTKYEPINRPQSDQGLWINNAMDYLGVSTGNYFNRVENYDNSIRDFYGMDWATTIFVIDSNNDVDGMFTDSYFGYAYLNGPFIVMTYDNDGYGISNMDVVTAHEFGHIFGAADQYSGAWSCDQIVDCSSLFGYLSVENQNCEIGCSSNVASIMRGLISPYTNNQIDSYAKGQVGWRDLNSNGINDAIETPYNTGTNSDSDTIIDYWDTDDDNDGILDTSDNCLTTPGIAYYNGCPDTYPPNFSNWIFGTPNKTYNNLPIKADIIDPSGVNSAILHYDYGNNGIEEGTIVMSNSGNTYSATIPASGKNYRNQNVAFYITATDNLNYKGNSTKQLIYIENTAPTIDSYNPSSPQTINETQSISFTHNSSDLDGDTLTYKWLLDSIQKATTQNWIYTTDYSSAGTHAITIEVSDGISAKTQNWTVNVNNVNRIPTWNFVPQNQNIVEDTPLSYQVSASDLDNDTITYFVNDSAFAINSNGLLTWTPPLNWNGNKEVIVTASDGTTNITSNIGIVVSPVNDAPTLNAISNQIVNENQLLTFIITGSDVESDPLIYSADNLPTGANFDSLTQTFTWTPTYEQSGVYTINFTISDSQLTDSKQNTITVNNINRAPTTINIPDQNWDEDNIRNLDLSVYFSDPDGDVLTYSILTNPININAQINGNISSLTPNSNWNGANTIQFRASDGSLTVDSNILNLNINPINDIPTIIITSPTNNQIFTQGDAITFTGTANDIEDGVISNNIEWTSNIDNILGTFSTNNLNTLNPGKHTITGKIKDSLLAEGSSNLIIYVNTLGNTAPIANAGADQSINTNNLVTLDGNQSSDAENNVLTYLWTQTSGSAVILSSTTSAKPTFTPTADGTYTFSLIVSDGILDSIVDTITVTSSTPSAPSGGGGGGGGGGGSTSEDFIDLSKTPQATITKRENGDYSMFSLTGSDKYKIIFEKLDKSSLKILMSNNPYTTLNVGETKEYDVTKDGINDISLSYNKYYLGAAEMTLKKLSTPAKETPKVEEQKTEEPKEQPKEETDNSNEITGAVTGGGSSKGLITVLIALGVVGIGVAGYVFYRKEIYKIIKKKN